MRKVQIIVSYILFLVIGSIIGWHLGSSQPVYDISNRKTSESCVTNTCSSKPTELQLEMRKLWEDHVIWTRLYIVSFLTNQPDSSKILARLIKNQEQIGDAFKIYYGDQTGDKLTDLLKTHIELADEVVKFAKEKNVASLTESDKKWHENGNEIAGFLNAQNQNWPKDMMRSMFKDHLDLTKQEAVDILLKRHDAAIADFDKIHNQILQMADMLTDGIISQFPDNFK